MEDFIAHGRAFLFYGYMKTIKASNGFEIICDDDVYDKAITKKWCVGFTKNRQIACAQTGIKDQKKGYVSLRFHYLVLPKKEGFWIDHINGNPLDNRKANLRYVTPQQNAINRKKQDRPSKSKYKGLTWCKQTNRWRVVVYKLVDGKRVKVFSRFFKADQEIEAARCYNEYAVHIFGEYANINKLD